MATPTQLHSYCVQQLHMIDAPLKTVSTWSSHMTWTLFGDAIIAVFVGVLAYDIGKYGLSAVYNWIKSKFTKTTVVTTPVVTL
jgi:hypothetical protein